MNHTSGSGILRELCTKPINICGHVVHYLRDIYIRDTLLSKFVKSSAISPFFRSYIDLIISLPVSFYMLFQVNLLRGTLQFLSVLFSKRVCIDRFEVLKRTRNVTEELPEVFSSLCNSLEFHMRLCPHRCKNSSPYICRRIVCHPSGLLYVFFNFSSGV
jgi:hypothetical protein